MVGDYACEPFILLWPGWMLASIIGQVLVIVLWSGWMLAVSLGRAWSFYYGLGGCWLVSKLSQHNENVATAAASLYQHTIVCAWTYFDVCSVHNSSLLNIDWVSLPASGHKSFKY